MKYTKNCLWPWKYMLIHAGGLMQTCACASDLEIGDILIDYFENPDKENIDVFNLESIQKVREGLLSGNLRKMCRDCAWVSDELITTDELKAHVMEYLVKSKGLNSNAELGDLKKEYAYHTVGIGLSNRCNLRCLYCNQSTCAETNPFYKAEFPKQYVEEALELIVKSGAKSIIPAVEGEITIYPHWYEIYSKFMEQHPEVGIALTTNLNKKYTEAEIELLAKHARLDISCDTLDPELYSKIRVNGKLDLLLENLERIRRKKLELGIEHTIITIHFVVCNLTWRSMEEVADFAFEKGYGLNIGNYEERRNARGYIEGILKPISALPYEEQVEAARVLEKIKGKAEKLGLRPGVDFVCHGDIIQRSADLARKKFHRFTPVLEDVVYRKYYEQNPLGEEHHHLDIVYDDDNTAFSGIRTKGEQRIHIEGLQGIDVVIVREIKVYKKGYRSPKYDWAIGMGYRKKHPVNGGVFDYVPQVPNEQAHEDAILTVIETYERRPVL